MDAKIETELTAIKAVVTAVENLEPPMRMRVLKAAEALLAPSQLFPQPRPPIQPRK
jgi:hypothetical protein